MSNFFSLALFGLALTMVNGQGQYNNAQQRQAVVNSYQQAPAPRSYQNQRPTGPVGGYRNQPIPTQPPSVRPTMPSGGGGYHNQNRPTQPMGGGYQQQNQARPANGYSNQNQARPTGGYQNRGRNNDVNNGGSYGQPLPYMTVPPPLPTSATRAPQPKRNAKSEGQCNFDSSKFTMQAQCAIAKAVMFDRMTGSSCEECLEECLKFQDSSSPWICRAVTYDHRWLICDLYAVNGTQAPYFLTDYPGRDYFSVNPGVLDSTTTAATTTGATTDETTTEGTTAETTTTAAEESTTTGEESTTTAEESTTTAEESTTTAEESTTTAEEETTTATEEETTTTAEETTTTEEETTTAANEPVCTDGKVARFCKWQDKVLPGNDDEKADADDEEACRDLCKSNTGVTCKSFEYGDNGCILSTSAADSPVSNPTELQNSTGNSYFEKICVESDLAEGTDDVWNVVPNYILVGHVQEVTDATSILECKVHCLESSKRYGFECRSAMFYPSDPDQNCLLNSVTKDTQSDVFVQEQAGVNMAYFDVGKASSRFSRRLKDETLKLAGHRWTQWSKCLISLSGYRYRYLKCKEKDVRRCPKQTLRCALSKITAGERRFRVLTAAAAHPVGACLAVKDDAGNKRCPHGMRRLSNGERRYCRRPIDC